jgi:hypothetical protein
LVFAFFPSERCGFEILTMHMPAPAALDVLEIVATDEHSILRRLVGSEMRHQTPVAECRGIPVQHEDAAGMPGDRQQLAGAAASVEIPDERPTELCSSIASEACAKDGRP